MRYSFKIFETLISSINEHTISQRLYFLYFFIIGLLSYLPNSTDLTWLIIQSAPLYEKKAVFVGTKFGEIVFSLCFHETC